ncbi:L-carnitine dehydrogenase [Brucella abortus]|nr:L-carnitine dehydrogenase [Brucella abortus]AEW18909.1 L-carnitine dehydrogenase [Brucella abortus A13334]
MLGEHTDTLLQQLAKLDDDRLNDLKSRGIIEQFNSGE